MNKINNKINSKHKSQKILKLMPDKTDFIELNYPSGLNSSLSEFDGHMTRKILNSWGFTNPAASRLHLAKKSIKSLAFNTFSNFLQLKSLNMSFNQIKVFNWDALANLNGLQYLNLSHNCITQIDFKNFTTMSGLRELNLSHNKITEIDDFTFIDLEVLKRLNLSNNYLKVITTGTFGGLGELSVICLENNEISFVSADALVRMKKIMKDLRRPNCVVIKGYNGMIQASLGEIFKGNPIGKKNLCIKNGLIHFDID